MSDAKSDTNKLQRVSFARQTDSGAWADEFGFVGPIKPGVGPRSNPVGWFPTGPEIGEALPAIAAFYASWYPSMCEIFLVRKRLHSL